MKSNSTTPKIICKTMEIYKDAHMIFCLEKQITGKTRQNVYIRAVTSSYFLSASSAIHFASSNCFSSASILSSSTWLLISNTFLVLSNKTVKLVRVWEINRRLLECAACRKSKTRLVYSTKQVEIDTTLKQRWMSIIPLGGYMWCGTLIKLYCVSYVTKLLQ